MKIKTLLFFNSSNKKKMKQSLKEVITLRQKQIADIEKLTKPFKDNINIIKQFFNNEIPFNHVLKHNEQVANYLRCWINGNKK